MWQGLGTQFHSRLSLYKKHSEIRLEKVTKDHVFQMRKLRPKEINPHFSLSAVAEVDVG
jgi:hypothetical protein